MKFPRLGGLLLAAVLLPASYIALSRQFHSAQPTDGRIVIRLAHYQLEEGMRQAFTELGRRYMALHPDVRIEQLPVPVRSFRAWIQTQLVGGTVPDIVQLSLGTEQEKLVAYFRPLSEWVEQPNPYNAGTDLADLRWRETFLDGLDNEVSYPPNLLDYYGVNLTIFTTRLFYNRTLWRQLTGTPTPPATYAQFVAACRHAEQTAATHHQPLTLIAGSTRHGPLMMDHLFSSQTQRLYDRIDPIRMLKYEPTHPGVLLIRGDWSFDDPAIISGAEVMRDVASLMQPGFATADRDEAVFRFLQGRALMVAVGSWDAKSLSAQAPFEVGIIEIPRPTSADPRHGPYTYELMRDRGNTHGSFGVTRASAHPEVAVDFLRFVTSQRMNTLFSEISYWIPSVRGAQPPDFIKPFQPEFAGHLPGFDLKLFYLGPDLEACFRNYLHELIGPQGSVEKWRTVMTREYLPVVRDRLERRKLEFRASAMRQDTRLVALYQVTRPSETPSATLSRQLREIGLEQNEQEALAGWIESELNRPAASR